MADLVEKLRFVASGQDDVQSQALTAAADEIERLRGLYEELLFAVGNKYPGETRHQTALRYIQKAELPRSGCDAAGHAATSPSLSP